MLSMFAFFVSLVLPTEAVTQLQTTAPSYLTAETAREHLAAATVAA